MADQYTIKVDRSKAASVDAYLEYKRIVGEDDGGVMFTPEEYEDYKKKVLPMRIKNRLFTSWSGPSGIDCKQIGPETLCFCKHRYKQHKTDFHVIPEERPIRLPCRAKGCRCSTYLYVPMNGGQPIRCTCKHPSDDHKEAAPFVCKKGGCTKCVGFKSPFTCGCGSPVHQHQMIVETADEREARGHPVGQATPYAAMGGLTGFSSLAEGYMRLDPSGIGAPDEEFLSQEITANDNPFLRANVQAIKAHKMAKQGITGPNAEVFEDITERVSTMKRPGETDMDFYERRYQERLKAEKAAKRRDLGTNLRVAPRKAIEPKRKAANQPSTSLARK
ncbi:protein FAM221A-like [Gigantopelta aegis]|uniref:protein FAM221A-like n=1 Tax=Gigantopelta aegis TaxID=1735272 RepID=UPI001B889F9A|nr:protein FAM221A-like [Gigantopelta aegis]